MKRDAMPMTEDGAPLLACTIPPLPQTGERWTYLYAIRRRGTGEIKIGVSIEPWGRIRGLQTAHGEPLELALALPVPLRASGTRNFVTSHESDIHERFQQWHKRGEWFAESPEMSSWIEECGNQIPAYPDVASIRIPLMAPKCDGIGRNGLPCSARVRYVAKRDDGTLKWLCAPHGKTWPSSTLRHSHEHLLALA